MNTQVITREELAYMQSLPFSLKLKIGRDRVREFMNAVNGDAYVAFSGGIDSTVLLDFVRNYCGYPNVPGVYLDTWLEYPQIREFVHTKENIISLKPKLPMKEIIERSGWNFPSKEVAAMIEAYRRGVPYAVRKMAGLDARGNPSIYRQSLKKWIKLAETDIPIGPKCCYYQKESVSAVYEKQSGLYPIVGLLASDSRSRRNAYLKTGCNALNSKRKLSKPLSIFTSQDILEYVYTRHLPYANSVYGVINKCSKCYQCTGESQSGCMFCPTGAHMDGLAKFKRLKAYDRNLYDYCMEELGEKRLIEWIEQNLL